MLQSRCRDGVAVFSHHDPHDQWQAEPCASGKHAAYSAHLRAEEGLLEQARALSVWTPPRCRVIVAALNKRKWQERQFSHASLPEPPMLAACAGGHATHTLTATAFLPRALAALCSARDAQSVAQRAPQKSQTCAFEGQGIQRATAADVSPTAETCAAPFRGEVWRCRSGNQLSRGYKAILFSTRYLPKIL